jgi:hypothetical protein
MNSNTSGWLVLTRNFVAGSHPQNESGGKSEGGIDLPALFNISLTSPLIFATRFSRGS